MVELTQSVTQQKEEKKAMQAQLESQLQSWIDKYEKMEKRMRQLEQDLQNSKAAEEALQHSHESLQQDYNTLLAKSGEHEKENSRLNAEITKLREQSQQQQPQQQPPLRVSTTPTNGRTTSTGSTQRVEEDANINELKSQIAALKAQLKNNINGPRRQPSVNNLGSRNLSPAAQQMSPTANGRRAVSPDRMINNGRRRSSRAEQQGTVTYANREQMRPMSIDHSDTLRELDVGNNPEEAVCAMTHHEFNDVMIDLYTPYDRCVPSF